MLHLFRKGSVMSQKKGPAFDWQFDARLLQEVRPHVLNLRMREYADYVLQELDPDWLGPKNRSVLPAKDIDEFEETLAFVIARVQELSGILPSDQLEIREEFTNLLPERPVLTWKLVGRKPGLVSAGNVKTQGVREYTTHVRSVGEDPENAGHSIVTSGRYRDNHIELCTWGKSAKEANRWALWLEDIMEEYQWLFMREGFNRILFEERLKDTYKELGSNHIFGCPAIYFIRTERVTVRREAMLKRILYSLSIQNKRNT
jgi:hypothetical protein